MTSRVLLVIFDSCGKANYFFFACNSVLRPIILEKTSIEEKALARLDYEGRRKDPKIMIKVYFSFQLNYSKGVRNDTDFHREVLSSTIPWDLPCTNTCFTDVSR